MANKIYWFIDYYIAQNWDRDAYSKYSFGLAQCFPKCGLRNTSSESQAVEIQALSPHLIPLRSEFEMGGPGISLCKTLLRDYLYCKYCITSIIPQIWTLLYSDIAINPEHIRCFESRVLEGLTMTCLLSYAMY